MQDFQAFTVRFNRRVNVLICNVGFSQAFRPTPGVPIPPRVEQVAAIWDTGASFTVVTKALAQRIGLKPTGKTIINGVNHASEESTYMVNVYLPNRVCITHVKIAEVPALSGGAEALIGMDIIGSGDFSVHSENNMTVMSYRFPGIGGMDYVQEAGRLKVQQQTVAKIEQQKKLRKPVDKASVRAKRKKERMNKKKARRK